MQHCTMNTKIVGGIFVKIIVYLVYTLPVM